MEIGRIHTPSTKEVASASNAFYSARVPFAFLEKMVLKSLLAPPKTEQVVVSQDKHNVLVAYIDKKTGKPTHSALISRKHFEQARNHLGRQQVLSSGEFHSGNASFIINAVDDSLTAEMAFGTGDEFSQYAAEPMAMVFNGRMHVLVCQTDGRIPLSSLSKAGKAKFARAVVKLLSALHNKGFVTGGLPPDAVVYDGKDAKVKNLARLQAMVEQDSLRHEVAVTLARLLSAGYITKEQVEGLAKFYLDRTVVGRADVESKLAAKASTPPRAVAGPDMKSSVQRNSPAAQDRNAVRSDALVSQPSASPGQSAHKAITELALKGYV